MPTVRFAGLRAVFLSAGLLTLLASVVYAQVLGQGDPRARLDPNRNPRPTVLGNAPTQAPAPAATLGVISGRVLTDGGKPAVGFTVTACSAVRPFLRLDKDNPNTATTGLDGRYVIVLRQWSPMVMDGPIVGNVTGYTVTVSNGGKPYVEPPAQNVDPETQPNHTAANVDFSLLLGPLVTVRVADAITGAPDAGIAIHCQDDVAGVVHGVTGADGALTLRLPITRFSIAAALPETLEAAPGYGIGSDPATQCTVLPGQQFVWNLKTYGTGLLPSRTGAHVYGSTGDTDWHGVVLGRDGRPVSGAQVQILRAGYERNAIVTTDAQGRFSAPLPRFDYGELGGQWSYFPRPVVLARRGTLTAAQVVTLEESWYGMTVRLARGASFVGTLTDPEGHPAGHVEVSTTASILGITGLKDAPDVVTDHAGRFSVTGLAPGAYTLTAHGGGFGTFGICPPVPVGSIPRPSLDLAAGEQRDLGRIVVDRADRVLAGIVLDGAGKPAPYLYVSVTGAHTHQTAVTQSDGTFHVYDLADEPLTVAVGVPDHEVTASIASGQDTVRLIAPPDVVATNGRGAVPTPSGAPVSPQPAATPRAVSTTVAVPLDGLLVQISPGDDGGFQAEIVRPDVAEVFGIVPPQGRLDFSAPAIVPARPLAALDGAQLTVSRDHGTLTDRAGDVLWSGMVVDPPDYVVITDPGRNDESRVTVQDHGGKTLWSGAAIDTGNVLSDGDLRVIGPDHAVAWERAVGDARVVSIPRFHGDIPGFTVSDLMPIDGTLSLHVVPATATLTSADGRRLWSGQAPVLSVAAVGDLARPHLGSGPPPGRVPSDYLPPRFHAWQPLLTVRGAIPGVTLNFTDAAGHLIPEATEAFH